jgi:hypothetical protein
MAKKDKLIGYGVNGEKVYESSKKRFWNCKCDCGNVITVSEYDLLMGLVTCCSECAKKEK